MFAYLVFYYQGKNNRTIKSAGIRIRDKCFHKKKIDGLTDKDFIVYQLLPFLEDHGIAVVETPCLQQASVMKYTDIIIYTKLHKKKLKDILQFNKNNGIECKCVMKQNCKTLALCQLNIFQ